MESRVRAFENGSKTVSGPKGMVEMVTFWGVLLVLGFLAVARYGAEHHGEDPTGRDPAWPATRRPHTVRGDAVLLGELARRAAAHRALWSAYDRSLRPWETGRPDGPDGRRGLTRRS